MLYCEIQGFMGFSCYLWILSPSGGTSETTAGLETFWKSTNKEIGKLQKEILKKRNYTKPLLGSSEMKCEENENSILCCGWNCKVKLDLCFLGP